MANQGVEALSTVLATYQNGGNVTQTVTAAAAQLVARVKFSANTGAAIAVAP